MITAQRIEYLGVTRSNILGKHAQLVRIRTSGFDNANHVIVEG